MRSTGGSPLLPHPSTSFTASLAFSVRASEKVTIQTNEMQCPRHGELASRVCRRLLMTTKLGCCHVTLAHAPNENHIGPSAELLRSSVSSGEARTSRSGPFLPFISTPTSGHRLILCGRLQQKNPMRHAPPFDDTAVKGDAAGCSVHPKQRKQGGNTQARPAPGPAKRTWQQEKPAPSSIENKSRF